VPAAFWFLAIQVVVSADPSTRPEVTAQEIEGGRALFQAQCAYCHGEDGAGGRGANLARPVLRRASTDEMLFGVVTRGIPGTGMPRNSMSAREAWQVVAYVRSLNLKKNLTKLTTVFGRMLQVLGGAGSIFKDGPAVKDSLFADAPMGGFSLFGTNFFAITFRPGFVNCGPNCRAAMIVHECAHFVGNVNEITHFAMEFPAPNGQAQGKGNTRNYKQLLTDEALKNASSYAAFAIHATTGVDSRFGASNISIWEVVKR